MTQTPNRKPALRRPPSRAPRTDPPRYAGWVTSSLWFAGLLGAAALIAAWVGSAVTMAPAVIGVEQPAAGVRYGIPIIRTVLDVAVVAAVGLALLAKFLGFDRPERTEPVMIPARRWAVWASWVWTLAALTTIVLLAAEVTGSSPSPAQVWQYITDIPAGKGLLISAAFGLISVWVCRVSNRHGERVPAELRAGIALMGLLPLPLTGHASNWYWHDFTMMAMELHVVGSSAWAGGLAVVVLLLARHPSLLAVALPRYSKLATVCVFVVGVTGLFTGLAELALSPTTSLPESLWQTRYGVLILAKAVFLAVIAGIALYVRGRLLRRIADGATRGKAAGAVALWCGWELVVLALAFGVAVVLTRTAVVPF